MSKKATSSKDIKVAPKNIKKNNSDKKVRAFSIADVSTSRRGK